MASPVGEVAQSITGCIKDDVDGRGGADPLALPTQCLRVKAWTPVVTGWDASWSGLPSHQQWRPKAQD